MRQFSEAQETLSVLLLLLMVILFQSALLPSLLALALAKQLTFVFPCTCAPPFSLTIARTLQVLCHIVMYFLPSLPYA